MSARRVLQQHLSKGAKVFQNSNVKAEPNSISSSGAFSPSSIGLWRADKLTMSFCNSWKYQSQVTHSKFSPSLLCQTGHTAGACVHFPTCWRLHPDSRLGPPAASAGLVRRVSQLATRRFVCGSAGKLTSGHSIGRHAAWHEVRRASHAVGERDRSTKCIAGAFGKDAACPPHLQIQLRASQGPGRSSTTSAVAVRTDTAPAHAVQSRAEAQVLDQLARSIMSLIKIIPVSPHLLHNRSCSTKARLACAGPLNISLRVAKQTCSKLRN